MRRAMVASITAVLLLSSLTVLALALAQQRRSYSRAKGFLPETLAFAAALDDLSSGFSEGLFGMSVVELSNGSLLLEPAGFLSPAIDHEQRLDSYREAAALLSAQQHLTLSLAGGPSFAIEPQNITLTFNGSQLSGQLGEAVQSLRITAMASAVNATLNSSPAASGDTPVEVHIRDAAGNTALSTTVLLDLAAENAPFEVSFSNASVSVEVSSSNLLITSAGTAVNVTTLALEFLEADSLLRSDVMVTLNSSTFSVRRPLMTRGDTT